MEKRKQAKIICYKLNNLTTDYLLSKLRCTYKIVDEFSSGIDCKFAKLLNHRNVLACLYGNGIVSIEDTKCHQRLTSFGPFSHACSLAWSEQTMKLAFGDLNGNLTTVDILPSGDGFHLCKNFGSVIYGQIRTICFKPETVDTVVAGSSLGFAIVWDSRESSAKYTSRVKHLYSDPTNDDNDRPIVFMLFSDDYHIVTATLRDPDIMVWDIRKLCETSVISPTYTIDCRSINCYHRGFNHAVINSSKTRLYASSDCGKIATVDLVNFCIIPGLFYKGATNVYPRLKLALTPDENYLAGSDKYGNVLLWKLNYSSCPIFRLNEMYVTAVSGMDWSNDGDIKLAATSNGGFVSVWTPQGSDYYDENPLISGPSVIKLNVKSEIFNKNIR